jgi:hypothetical protein
MAKLYFLFLIYFTLSGVQTAFGCDCALEESVAKEFDRASVVFVEELTKKPDSEFSSSTDSNYLFKVIEVFKGANQEQIVLKHTLSDCSIFFEVGKIYLVYAQGKKELTTNICTKTKLFKLAGSEVVELKTLMNK